MSNEKAPTASSSSQPLRGPSEILKARARELARRPYQEQAGGDALHLLEFRLAKERYAIEHAYVREVIVLKDLTPLPCTPDFILGIMSVRGQILPLLDVRKFFDLPETGITDLHLVMVVRSNDIELGILADDVAGVRSISLNSVQPSLPTLTGVRAQYLKGVTDEHVVILDVLKILNDPKIIVNEDVDS
jgi:purine-binding chemotaxis protein CheW